MGGPRYRAFPTLFGTEARSTSPPRSNTSTATEQHEQHSPAQPDPGAPSRRRPPVQAHIDITGGVADGGDAGDKLEYWKGMFNLSNRKALDADSKQGNTRPAKTRAKHRNGRWTFCTSVTRVRKCLPNNGLNLFLTSDFSKAVDTDCRRFTQNCF